MQMAVNRLGPQLNQSLKDIIDLKNGDIQSLVDQKLLKQQFKFQTDIGNSKAYLQEWMDAHAVSAVQQGVTKDSSLVRDYL